MWLLCRRLKIKKYGNIYLKPEQTTKSNLNQRLLIMGVFFTVAVIGFMVKLPSLFRHFDKELHASFYFLAAAFINILFMTKKLKWHVLKFVLLASFGVLIEFSQAYSNKFFHKRIHGRFDPEDLKWNLLGLISFSVLWLIYMGTAILYKKVTFKNNKGVLNQQKKSYQMKNLKLSLFKVYFFAGIVLLLGWTYLEIGFFVYNDWFLRKIKILEAIYLLGGVLMYLLDSVLMLFFRNKLSLNFIKEQKLFLFGLILTVSFVILVALKEDNIEVFYIRFFTYFLASFVTYFKVKIIESSLRSPLSSGIKSE